MHKYVQTLIHLAVLGKHFNKDEEICSRVFIRGQSSAPLCDGIPCKECIFGYSSPQSEAVEYLKEHSR